MSDIAIKVEHLSKYYRLGVINHGMLYKDIQSWMARKLGKEDPHSRIGEDHFADRPEGFWALKDLCFDIKRGDRVGIIGKNGAGKSTLLKILSRITAPTEGRAYIKGRVASLLEVGTGFHGELTGRENIFLNGAILGMKRGETARKLEEIVEFSEMGQYIDTPVKRYSSGMYVRLAFAVAAHLDSDILIADEVLAVGDAAFQRKALGKMGELSRGQGRTVLFVSHNMHAVKQLCSDGIILEKGRVKEIGHDIATLVGDYLHGDQSSEKQGVEWANDGTCETREFRLDGFRITEADGAKVVRPISAERPLRVSVEFTCKEQCPGLVTYLTFFSDDDNPVFVVSPHAQIPDYRPRLGKNSLSFTIPSGLLIDKEYRIEFSASLHQVRGLVVSGENAPCLSLRVDRRKNFSSYAENNVGMISPVFSWQVE